jgi:hypothetical protein
MRRDIIAMSQKERQRYHLLKMVGDSKITLAQASRVSGIFLTGIIELTLMIPGKRSDVSRNIYKVLVFNLLGVKKRISSKTR